MALLPGQALSGIASFGSVAYLPEAVSGVAAAMLWMWVFNGEVGNVICRWLLAGSVAVLLPGLIIFFFFQKMFVNKTRRAIAFRLMVE